MQILALTLVLSLAAGSTAGAAPTSVAGVEVKAAGRFVRDPNSRETAADCARFRPTVDSLRRWFARAHEVQQPQWLEEGDYSPCRADGVVRMRDGRRRPFEIGQGGQARIRLAGRRAVYLLGPALP